MTSAVRLARVAVAASILLAMQEIPEWRTALVIVGLTVAIAWRVTPDFWRLVRIGGTGGALAGLAVLGPGWRVSMRVVAIVDRYESPEFSLGGTALVIAIGALIGGLIGVVGHLLRQVANLRSPFLSAATLGLLTVGSLVGRFSSDLSNLGAGLWINLILFGVVAILYGLVAVVLTDRLAGRVAPPRERFERRVSI